MTAANRPHEHLKERPGGTGATEVGAPRQVLIVGDDALATIVRQALQTLGVRAVPQRVDNFLMALGHAGTNEPAAVVGQSDRLDDTASATGAAMRHLLPTSTLLLVAETPNDAAAMQAVKGGFDACLAAGASPQAIAAALAPAFDLASPPDAAASQPAKSPTVDDASEPPPVDTPSSAEQSAPASARTSATASASAAARRTASDQMAGQADTADEASPDSELGDVDLVEHLLRGENDIQGLAVRLIAGRSGLTGLQLWRDPAAVPAGYAATPVVFDGESFGMLASPKPTSVVTLMPWAAWLARWLALGKRTDALWDAAFRDELTQVWNRRYFNRYLGSILDRAIRQRFRVTVMIFDIDDFKTYNDRYGHPAGDEILYETARLMRTVVREHDVVARIGGDEFGVIFWDADEPRRPNSQHPLDVRQATERFRKAIRDHQFPKLRQGAPGTLTISGGLAGYPWDGRTAEQLVELADARALQSKRHGKNAITFGPGADFDAVEPT